MLRWQIQHYTIHICGVRQSANPPSACSNLWTLSNIMGNQAYQKRQIFNPFQPFSTSPNPELNTLFETRCFGSIVAFGICMANGLGDQTYHISLSIPDPTFDTKKPATPIHNCSLIHNRLNENIPIQKK